MFERRVTHARRTSDFGFRSVIYGAGKGRKRLAFGDFRRLFREKLGERSVVRRGWAARLGWGFGKLGRAGKLGWEVGLGGWEPNIHFAAPVY